MIYNSCNFPKSCDCSNCEEVNMNIKSIENYPFYKLLDNNSDEYENTRMYEKLMELKSNLRKEEINMRYSVSSNPKSKVPQIIKNMFESKRKGLFYKERKELIKDYFSDVKKEYNEANNATNIYNMLAEILEVIPKDILQDNNTMRLFKSALQDTTGIEIKTEPTKPTKPTKPIKNKK